MLKNASYEFFQDNKVYPYCWYAKNNYCIPHFHNSLEFVFVLSGEINAMLDSQLITAKKREMILVPSYTIHSYSSPSPSECLIMLIPLSIIPSMKKLFLDKTFEHLLLPECNITDELMHCMTAIQNHSSSLYQNISDDAIHLLKGYSYVFTSLVSSNVGLLEVTNKKGATLAQKILLYIQNNYTSSITLDHIAQNFGYSRSRFSHIFNEYFGCNLTDYINGLRCQHASELLSERGYSVADAALSSGFESLRTFHRVYKKQYGHTPGQKVSFQNQQR